MSSLQLGLAILGGIVLLAVVVYNAWQTRRHAPRTARERADLPATPSSERIDPSLDGEQPAGDSTAADPSLGHLPLPERKPALDALIDSLVPLNLEHPVSGDAVLAALPPTRRVGSKPFAVEGLHADTGQWEAPRAGQRYSALQVGLQLANRAGAMNQIEFSEFVAKIQALADALSAMPDFPDMMAEVARARELDHFATGHDAQLAFTLRARRAAWSPGYLAQQASAQGFVAGALPGRMVLPSAQAHAAPLLTLSFDPQAAMAEDPEQSALRTASLALEVTHVPRSEDAFARLRHAAFALAQSMEGAVTDERGEPLGEAGLDMIADDLQRLYDALDSRDLAAGSPQARRLFS
jgi:hypothetical protein